MKTPYLPITRCARVGTSRYYYRHMRKPGPYRPHAVLLLIGLGGVVHCYYRYYLLYCTLAERRRGRNVLIYVGYIIRFGKHKRQNTSHNARTVRTADGTCACTVDQSDYASRDQIDTEIY